MFIIKTVFNYDSSSVTDMEFVKNFTQARFLKTKFYPKVRKSEWTQDCKKNSVNNGKIQ